MNRGKKTLFILSTLILSLVLTGCWDRLELEKRSFIMVVGIDKYDPDKSKTKEEHKPEANEENKIKMTYLLPKFSAIKEGEEGEDSRQLLTSVGKTSYHMTRKLTVRSDSQPFFQHMKAAVFGADVLKDKEQFLQIIDGLERQDEISRKIHLFVAEDQAHDILQVESLLKPLSYKLQGMSQEQIGTNLFIPKTLEEVISSTIQGATLIPKITASDEEIKVAGSAVMKEHEFIGWLGEMDTKFISALRGEPKNDIAEINYKGVDVPFIIKELKVKRSAEVIDGQINMNFKVEMSGNIQQYRVNRFPRLTDIDVLADMEKEIDRKVGKNISKAVSKVQNEMNADVLKVGEYLKGHKPDVWDQVKSDWDEFFPEVKINVRVDSYIEQIGSIK